MKTEMQREYEQLCRIDENPGVQGLAQLGRNAINRVSRLESQLARADARIAELERNIERLDAQWREELRIYRESGDARIAELEAALRRVRRWCMGSGYSASVRVAMKEWIDGGMVGGMPELTGLEAAIDAARANGGEG